MTQALDLYRLLELRLWDTRWRHEGKESLEEDAILDEMDQAWFKLSDGEKAQLKGAG